MNLQPSKFLILKTDNDAYLYENVSVLILWFEALLEFQMLSLCSAKLNVDSNNSVVHIGDWLLQNGLQSGEGLVTIWVSSPYLTRVIVQENVRLLTWLMKCSSHTNKLKKFRSLVDIHSSCRQLLSLIRQQGYVGLEAEECVTRLSFVVKRHWRTDESHSYEFFKESLVRFYLDKLDQDILQKLKYDRRVIRPWLIYDPYLANLRSRR